MAEPATRIHAAPRGGNGVRMWASWRHLVGLALLSACSNEAPPIGGIVDWPTGLPQAHGLDPLALDAMRDSLEARRTNAFLVARDGSLVYEWYDAEHGPGHRQGTASLAKALVGGMALLAAAEVGALDLDDRATDYVVEWRDDAERSGITIRHLASHSAGLPHRTADAWNEQFWDRHPDLFDLVVEEAPLLHAPGERFHYSGPGYAVLSYAITASLEQSGHADIRRLLRDRIMRPIGIPDDAWTIGYERSFQHAGLTLYASWSGATFTPRAMARVGQMMLQGGEWNGRRRLDRDHVEAVTAYLGSPLPDAASGAAHPAPALGWWTNANHAWPMAPLDAFAGVGWGGQVLLVIPSLRLVAVRTGEPLGDTGWGPGAWADLRDLIVRPLVGAVRS